MEIEICETWRWPRIWETISEQSLAQVYTEGRQDLQDGPAGHTIQLLAQFEAARITNTADFGIPRKLSMKDMTKIYTLYEEDSDQ